jgi:hypothetical protein
LPDTWFGFLIGMEAGGGKIMSRKLFVSLTASFMAATSLPADAVAQNAQQEAPPSSELIREIQQRLFDLNYSDCST